MGGCVMARLLVELAGGWGSGEGGAFLTMVLERTEDLGGEGGEGAGDTAL